MTNMNPYLPFASEILEVIRHTEKDDRCKMRKGEDFEEGI